MWFATIPLRRSTTASGEKRFSTDCEQNPSGSSLLRNTSFRSYIPVQGKAITVDDAKVVRSARYDGKYVLRSNAGLSFAHDVHRNPTHPKVGTYASISNVTSAKTL